MFFYFHVLVKTNTYHFLQAECKATVVEEVGVSSFERDCVFPFTYQGKTYNKCTKDNSANGNSWCAYEVNHDGVAVNGKWGDCNPGCPALGKLP